MRNRLLFLLLLVFLFAHVTCGQNLDDLRKEYVGKTVLLRGLYEGDDLKFDADGNVLGAADGGHWATARLEVTKLDLKHHHLIVRGKRKAVAMSKDGTLHDVYQGERKDWDKGVDRLDKAILTIAVSDRARMAASLGKILVVDKSEWKSVAPPYWRDYLDGNNQTPSIKAGEVFRTLADGTKVYKCGGPVRCPKPIDTPDPEYSEAARKARYMATATFEIVVDGNGRLGNIQVKKPAGMGLDENGVASLQKWRFKPAELDGKPVAVLLDVEVGWSLL